MKKTSFSLMAAMLLSGLVPVNAFAMLAPSAAADGGENVRMALESKEVRARLAAYGLTGPEIDSRLGRLSEKQMHQLARELDTLKPGGHFGRYSERDVLLIVLIVLLVAIII